MVVCSMRLQRDCTRIFLDKKQQSLIPRCFSAASLQLKLCREAQLPCELHIGGRDSSVEHDTSLSHLQKLAFSSTIVEYNLMEDYTTFLILKKENPFPML